jgi:hypothetical protein
MKLPRFRDFVEEDTTATTNQLHAIEARLRRIVTSAHTTTNLNPDEKWFIDQALKLAQRSSGKDPDAVTTLRALSLCALGAVIAGGRE